MATKNPKKTITSSKPNAYYRSPRNWCRRNYSGNVGSLLGYNSARTSNFSLDDEELGEDEEPRRTTIFSKTKTPPCHHRATCSSCYCQKKPIKPLLHCYKPKPCSTSPIIFINPDFHKANTTKSHSIATSRTERFTNQRQNYENLSSDYFLEIKNELERVSDELRQLQESNTVANVKKSAHKRVMDSRELQEFRKKNYFQCHNSGVDNSHTTIDHICVHKFILDDALKVKPKNCDVYGLSRCTICNKPMSNPNSVFQSRHSICAEVGSDVTTRSFEDDLPSFTNTSKKPKKIRKTVNKEIVEIQLPIDALNDEKLQKIRKKSRRILPTNSIALRFQKGVY